MVITKFTKIIQLSVSFSTIFDSSDSFEKSIFRYLSTISKTIDEILEEFWSCRFLTGSSQSDTAINDASLYDAIYFYTDPEG